jgi:HlyD family secretion protein
MAKDGKFGWVKWLVILALLAGAGYGYWYWKQSEKSAPQYQTSPVARGDLVQVVTATGQLNPVTNVQVGSQISGMIQKLAVDFNSPVKAGQIIAQLDPATYQASVHQSEADLANAKAGLELAQVDAKRSADLFQNNLIARSDYDKAMADLHQAEAQVHIKEAALEKAKVDLARCTISAPVDGIVISRSVDVGQTVAASLNAPTLFVIANDLSQMQIDANVAEADVGGVEMGQEVDFTVDAFLYRTFRGKVVQVRNSPITVQNVVTYDTIIAVHNEDLKLKPGMTANVSIIIARRENALKIPNAALRFRPPETASSAGKTNAAPRRMAEGGRGEGSARGWGGGSARGSGGGSGGGGGAGRPKGERAATRTVYVLSPSSGTAAGNNVPLPVPVKLGISDGINTEVVEGLNEGDLIITSQVLPEPSTTQPRGPNSPFGGGMRRF